MNFSNHTGCWVHARREFIRILDSDKSHRGAGQFVFLIVELYKIEARISNQNLKFIRKNRNTKILSDQSIKTLPNSPYGKALAYLYIQ
jgi:transposase